MYMCMCMCMNHPIETCDSNILGLVRPLHAAEGHELAPDEVDHLGLVPTDVLPQVEVHECVVVPGHKHIVSK